MNIYSDLDEKHTGSDTIRLSGKLKDFVYVRLRVLNAEIEKEDGDILVSVMKERAEIQFNHFSLKLKEKLQHCISAEDCNYLQKQILSHN
ncbi:MAG: hypothetical protein QM802_24885 [Agriterribacter sp.]